MADITLKAIENLLELKLDETFEKKLEPFKENHNQQMTALDGIAKNVKILIEEKTVATARIDRLEKWAEEVGKKIGVKFDLRVLQID